MTPFGLYDFFQIVVWKKDSPPPRQWVLENVHGAAGICVMMADKVDEELLTAGELLPVQFQRATSSNGLETTVAGPSLKVVSTFSVGYDHFDLPAVRARDIRIGYTPNVLNDAGTLCPIPLLRILPS